MQAIYLCLVRLSTSLSVPLLLPSWSCHSVSFGWLAKRISILGNYSYICEVFSSSLATPLVPHVVWHMKLVWVSIQLRVTCPTTVATSSSWWCWSSHCDSFVLRLAEQLANFLWVFFLVYKLGNIWENFAENFMIVPYIEPTVLAIPANQIRLSYFTFLLDISCFCLY